MELDDQTERLIQRSATHYGITFEEGVTRYLKIGAQGDNPDDPICVGCARRPEELAEYVDAIATTGLAVNHKDVVRRYVIREEGTYNRRNGHFLCTECYIHNGSPTSPTGWICP